MDNHVQLILVPQIEDGLSAALAEAKRRYSRCINFREGGPGCLFPGRFAGHLMGLLGTHYEFA